MNTTKCQKTGFWNFVFAFIPGFSEMFMGFMRMGISLLAVFFAGWALCATAQSDILLFIPFLTWFYGFFHARNIVHMEPEKFAQLEDYYIWEEFGDTGEHITAKTRNKFVAVVLILLGIMMLWHMVSYYLYMIIPGELWNMLSPIVAYIPETFIAVIIIVIGIKMIRGKKEELAIEGKENS